MEVKGIPVVSMANEERPGGDWESATMAPVSLTAFQVCFSCRVIGASLSIHFGRLLTNFLGPKREATSIS